MTSMNSSNLLDMYRSCHAENLIQWEWTVQVTSRKLSTDWKCAGAFRQFFDTTESECKLHYGTEMFFLIFNLCLENNSVSMSQKRILICFCCRKATILRPYFKPKFGCSAFLKFVLAPEIYPFQEKRFFFNVWRHDTFSTLNRCIWSYWEHSLTHIGGKWNEAWLNLCKGDYQAFSYLHFKNSLNL